MFKINLQLFSEEAVAEAPVAEGTAEESPVAEGNGDPGTGEPVSFDELINSNPEYKEALGKHVQSAIDKRFKNQKDLQKQLDALTPGLNMLAAKYGMGTDGKIDYEALMQEVLDDNSMYEDEAFKRGMSVEDYKHMRQMEVENAQLKAQKEANAVEEANRREFEAIYQQGEELKAIYPSFNLQTELSNPDFGRLIANNIPVQTAYEVVHKDEILSGGMEYAVQQTQKKIANSIQSGMKRPTENGLNAQSPASETIDPSKLTLKQIQEIGLRAQAGERIEF